jgi:hypothetical protein
MPNLDFFPTEIQEHIVEFRLNAKELGLEFIKSNILHETNHGIMYEYIFKYKDVFYKFFQDTAGSSFEEQCSCFVGDMFTIVVPKVVTITIYE